MKKISNKILICLLFAVVFINVFGCSCVKDNYKEYPFIESQNNGLVYNGVTYYQIFDTCWRIEEGFKEIVGKTYGGALGTITVPVYKHESLNVLKNGLSKYYVDGFVLPNEKDLPLDTVKVKLIDGYGYIKGTLVNQINEDVKENIFNNAITLSDIVNENDTISKDEFSIYDSKYSNIYCIIDAKTFFKDLNYFYFDTRFYLYEDRILLLLDDLVYVVKMEYSTKIREWVDSK